MTELVSPGNVRGAERGGRTIAVIGAGYSGTLTAINLLARCGPEDRVLLFERGKAFGRGVAYSAQSDDHLLNVRARNMSAFPHEPAHFVRWLQQRAAAQGRVESEESLADSFVPRGVYGSYLQDLLREAVAASGGRTLELVPDAVEAIAERDDGLTLTTGGGRTFTAERAVLAIGNFPPAPSGGAYVGDPWRPDALEGLDPAAAVLIVGTGLTMVDVALSLARRGHRGRIIALSRRGLLPHTHREGIAPAPVDYSALAAQPVGIVRLLRTVRRQARKAAESGRDWRTVIDGLRPHSQALWRALPIAERRRFLRHLRPWWDIHRHRMAPDLAAVLQSMRARGQLEVVAGRLCGMEVGEGGARLSLRRRGSGRTERLEVARVIDCTGLKVDFAAESDPLIRALLAEGQMRIDPLQLGVDVDPGTDALLDAEGRPSARLFAAGPWTRSAHWEMVAIPDLRVQCARLAHQLLHNVAPVAEQRPADWRVLPAAAAAGI